MKETDDCHASSIQIYSCLNLLQHNAISRFRTCSRQVVPLPSGFLSFLSHPPSASSQARSLVSHRKAITGAHLRLLASASGDLDSVLYLPSVMLWMGLLCHQGLSLTGSPVGSKLFTSSLL